MKYVLVFSVLALVGCSEPTPTYHVDQKLRHQYFEECLKTLPAGPQSTHYNDWDDVVEACDSAAYKQSVTDASTK